MLKPLPATHTKASRDEDLYRIFGGLINQKVPFMRQWTHCFTLMHKRYVNNLAKIYLKTKGLSLGMWLKGIKEGKCPDVLCLFLLCVVMGVHSFVHVKDGIWSTLFEEPAIHQECIQHCNLHFSYLGSGIYVELIPRVKTVQFQIFGVHEPINIDVDAKPIAIGTLTSDEQDTLQSLLRTSQSLTSTVTSNMPI